MIHSHKDLIVWQKSMRLVKLIYLMSERFPKTEVFGLVSQMRRAAVGIPSNIAEGFSRKHKKEWRQFLLIALGSYAELETQIILSKDLGYITDAAYQEAIQAMDEIGKMINKMISNLHTENFY